jgi:DNA-binding MarR family transcriptional regulator
VCRLRGDRRRDIRLSDHKNNDGNGVTAAEGDSFPPGDERQAVLAFYRLSRGLKNADLLRDLTWERLSTLSVVARREPVSITELSAVEEVTAPTISRTVAALEDQALVRCAANRHDGRSVLVSSTAKGRATLEKGMARTLDQLAEILGRLDTADLEAMADLIRRARELKRST